MKPLVFALDLDGTVMHSRRGRVAGDLCIERIDGEDRGFMLPEMRNALVHASECGIVIPVTSRSVEQFSRIEWGGVRLEAAYVANGGVRLCGSDAKKLFRQFEDNAARSLHDVACELENTTYVKRCVVVDGCYVLAYVDRPERDASQLADGKLDHFTFFQDRKKAYLFPKGLNKGFAIKQIRERISDAYIIGAGDSINDIAMLVECDVAIVPKQLLKDEQNARYEGWIACPEGRSFEEFVAGQLYEVEAQYAAD